MNKKGFAFIELTIVFVAIGILMMMGRPNPNKYIDIKNSEEILMDSTALATMVHLEVLEKGKFVHKKPYLGSINENQTIYKNGEIYEGNIGEIGNLYEVDISYIKEKLGSNKDLFLLDESNSVYHIATPN